METGTIIVLAVAWSICLGLWGLFFWLRHRGKDKLVQREPISTPFGLADVAIMLVLPTFMGGLFSSTTAVGLTSEEAMASPTVIFGFALGQLLGTGLAIAVICFRHRCGPAVFGWQNRRLLRDLVIGVIAFGMLIPPVISIHALVSSWIPYEHPTLDSLKTNTDMWLRLAQYLSAVIAAPIYEELFYRGTVQAWLHRLPPRSHSEAAAVLAGGWSEAVSESGAANSNGRLEWTAIVVSSLWFAAMHWGQGAAPVALFALGIGLGYLYRRTGGILPCMVVHFLLNGTTILLFSLNQ